MSDYYWEAVSGEIVRDVAGPVAMNSKLGWVLYGPVRSKGGPQGFAATSARVRCYRSLKFKC